MKKKKIIICLFLFLNFHFLPQIIKINQEEGVLQRDRENHITFYKFKKFQPDIHKIVLWDITKIIVHINKVFILDQRQSRIFVFDKGANYLYSIGRPGQGPGDLEYPIDFFISKEGNIYVINSMGKRIEVFSLNGNFQKRIKLNLPKEIFYSRPSCILVDPKQYFFIAYNLSSHLIDIYDFRGNYIKNILQRENPVIIPGENIGNSSQIGFFHNSNTLLHFNYFSGIFTMVSRMGKIEKIFSVSDKLHKKELQKLKKFIAEKRKIKKSGIRALTFRLWSNYCIDADDNIYVFLLLTKKSKKQKLFVFSPEGTFLYWTTIPYFKNTRINKIFCSEDDFIFVTSEQEIIFAKKRRIK